MAYIVKIDDKEYNGDIRKVGNGFKVLLNGQEIQVNILGVDKNNLTLIIDRKPYYIYQDRDNQLTVNGETYSFEIIDEQVARLLKSSPETGHKKELIITAPMPGLVIEIEIKEGDVVKHGQALIVVEAMKMQNEMKSPREGVVKKVLVRKGQTVNSKDALVIIE